MSMTRREHYRRAQALLSQADSNLGAERPRLTEPDRERLAVASVHATLAAAPADVAGETQPEAPDPDVEPAHLKAALRELADQDSVESTTYAAGFIWRQVFGEVMP